MMPIRVGVTALAALLLILSARGAFDAAKDGIDRVTAGTSRADVRGENQTRRQFERIQADLIAGVPPREVVYVPGPGTLWGQRLLEFAAIGDIAVTADPAQADLIATVVADTSAPLKVRLVLEAAR
ncbi:hypothetical protein HDA40_005149 [Hamadaea flava]|uniref:ABC transporter substrate-binding protein n=1 Tax=Hamadaea flava TaxID=1742688 RepID=A0ABV8LGM5_9ACTN|nr:hypothetical protein [Hamadaea flava]MCP2326642.1 hypothetical protein [Hamadaea flava]